VYVEIETPIDWLVAMDRLSVGSFYLLNVLYRKDIDVKDATLMKETGFGLSTHRKHKKELIDNGYLTLKQIGRGEYKYKIKDNHGCKAI